MLTDCESVADVFYTGTEESWANLGILAEREHTVHYNTSEITKQPTCINRGERTYTCPDCGDSYTEAIPAAGHKYTEKVIAPTYTAQGYTLHECAECGKSYKDNYTAKKVLANTKISGSVLDTKSITIKWNKIKDASGYKIYRYNSKTKNWDTYKTIRNANTTTCKVDKLKPGTSYRFKIRAFVKENGKNAWNELSHTYTTCTRPTSTNFTKTNISKTSVRLYWKKVACTGYKVQQYDAKAKKWKTVKIVKGVDNAKITGLKKNTSYRFRVQAYKRAGNGTAYGSWSSAKTVRTKK